jgi:murein DD-endopeptidase MepM/ murein hydrolase activator NlpD
MNIIVFGRGGRSRNLNLSGTFGIFLFGFVMLVAGFGFGSGFLVGDLTADAAPVDELNQLSETLAEQQKQFAALNGAAREEMDAMAIRVGELNANVFRLNALGRRLTDMADLEKGEFDFDNVPAYGGPEELAVSATGDQVVGLVADIDSLGTQLRDQEQQLRVLEGLLLNRKLYQRVYPKGRPVKSGWMSSTFGRRTDPFTGKSATHRGVDFAGKAGSEIVAVGAGVVTWAGDRYGYGQMIEINHGNGYVTRYAHNQENFVAVGDYVQPGQTIGLMGSTGRATGPNLHFEVWHLGRPVDPVRHIRQTS